MGFTLKVATGQGEGSEFAFDQPVVTLGRTADNDVVVRDAGASRNHARVFVREDRRWVEDLGSANGTTLNGAVLAAARVLRDGDVIAIGEVSLVYLVNDATLLQPPGVTAPQLDDVTLPPAAPPAEKPGDATVLVGALAPASDTQPSPALQPDTDRDLTLPPKRLAATLDAPSELSTRELMPVAPPPLARADDTTRQLPAREAVPSAAERARQRRQANASLMGRLRYAWEGLGLRRRRLVTGAALLVGLAVLAAIVSAALDRGPPRPVEPVELTPNAAPLEASFGLGEGVTWPRPDMKVFGFSLQAPTAMVAVVHFQAHDIASGEVAISLNGTQVGTVPADTADATRELEQVLPPALLQLKAPNQLLFDSTLNPPGSERWRISNLWLETVPVPLLSPEAAVTEAREAAHRADVLYESRDVGPDNLFRAWKTYREAWLALEALSERPAELHQYVRTRMREVRPELDQKCNGLLLDVQKLLNAKQPDSTLAVSKLKDIERYFPTREHPCFAQSHAALDELDARAPAPAP